MIEDLVLFFKPSVHFVEYNFGKTSHVSRCIFSILNGTALSDFLGSDNVEYCSRRDILHIALSKILFRNI